MGSFTVITAKESAIVSAENNKNLLMTDAREYIDSKQWPGKVVLGRLKGDELAQYNLWLDYLDALYVVDTSNPPDIVWPEKPI